MIRIALPDENLPWQDYLAGLGRVFRNTLKDMPGAHAFGSKLGPSTPAAFGIIDAALGVLMQAGFDAAGAWRAYGLVLDHAFRFVEKEESAARLEAVNGPGGYRILQLTGEALAPFPNLARSLAEVLPTDFEKSYEEQLACLIDGVAADLSRQRRARA